MFNYLCPVSKTEAIALYRPLLYSIALKMVGTLEDAEDIVQDTFEKWLKIDHRKVENVKAYLIKSVSNNCLSFLNSFWSQVAKDAEEEQDSLIDEQPNRHILNFDIDNQLTEAWSIIHRKLEPVERQIFVLREVFNVEYDELQLLLDKKKDNCRQIFSRAKAKLRADKDRLIAMGPSNLVPDSFKFACKTGSISKLIDDLK